MDDGALIESMLYAFFAHGGAAQRGLYRDNMRAALEIASAEIKRRTIERLARTFDGVSWSGDGIAAEIRSLNEAKP